MKKICKCTYCFLEPVELSPEESVTAQMLLVRSSGDITPLSFTLSHLCFIRFSWGEIKRHKWVSGCKNECGATSDEKCLSSYWESDGDSRLDPSLSGAGKLKMDVQNCGWRKLFEILSVEKSCFRDIDILPKILLIFRIFISSVFIFIVVIFSNVLSICAPFNLTAVLKK